ncbi:hypothetical protein KKF55_00700 [Patescibacteria group bacterium]|nr:hypothetical protein [Patescibacteria group bacterium]
MADFEAQRVRKLSNKKLREYIAEQRIDQAERKDAEHVLNDRIIIRNTRLKIIGLIIAVIGIIIANL